jgi:hypothetical protein
VTTCPNCRRPVVTREEWDARGDHFTLSRDTCWREFAGWDPCVSIARKAHEREDAALLADARCFPPGYLAEVAAILRAGAERHGCEPHETGAGQTCDDHLQHLLGHALTADNDMSAPGVAVPKPDPDSGRSQFAHVGARAALGWERERAAGAEP